MNNTSHDTNFQFTTRQMVLMLGILLPLFRGILFPASLAYFAGVSGIFTVAICMAIDFLVFLAIYSVYKKTRLSFFKIISIAFSQGFSRAVRIGYALLYFLKLVLFLSAQKLLIFNVLYENISSYFIFLPVVITLFYCGSKKLNSLARLFELTSRFVLPSLLAIFLLSAFSVNTENYFPIFGFGESTMLKSIYAFQIYFGDFIIFLLLHHSVRKDDLQQTPHTSGPKSVHIGWAFLINFLITMAFFLLFFGVFGTLASGQTYAISKLSKYTVEFGNIGRFDFLFIVIVGLGYVILSLLLFQTMLDSLAFFRGQKWIYSLAFSALLYIAVFFTSQNYQTVTTIATTILPPFAILMQIVLPALAPIFLKIANAKHLKTHKSQLNSQNSSSQKPSSRQSNQQEHSSQQSHQQKAITQKPNSRHSHQQKATPQKPCSRQTAQHKKEISK